ncbi:MAG: DUF4968 domain-containing protein, partial [Limisphaerales bacterium]
MKMPSFFLRMMALSSLIGLNSLLASCQTKPAAGVQPPSLPPSAAQRIPNGVQLNTAALNVKVQFYADDIVRVVKWLPGGTSEKSSLVVIQTNLPALDINFQENAATIILASGKITVQLSKSDGAIQYLTGDNQVILKEQG